MIFNSFIWVCCLRLGFSELMEKSCCGKTYFDKLLHVQKNWSHWLDLSTTWKINWIFRILLFSVVFKVLVSKHNVLYSLIKTKLYFIKDGDYFLSLEKALENTFFIINCLTFIERMFNNHFIFHSHINFRSISVLLLTGRVIWFCMFVFWFFWFRLLAFASSFPRLTLIFKYILIGKSIILESKNILDFMSDWANPQFFFFKIVFSKNCSVSAVSTSLYPAQAPQFSPKARFVYIDNGDNGETKIKATQFHLHKIYEDELER